MQQSMAHTRIEASPGSGEDDGARTAGLALQVGWLVVVVGATVLSLCSLPAYYHDILMACSGAVCNLDGSVTAADLQALGAAGITPQMYGVYTLALYLIALSAWLFVALLIFIRRANDPGALLIALVLATANVFAVNGPVTALALAYPALTLPINALMTLGDAGYTLLFLVFPDGRFVPRWSRWVALAMAVVSALTNLTPLDSPFNAPDSPIAAALSVAVLPIIILAASLQIYRYRRASTPRQREQSKWAVFGLIVTASGVLALNIGAVAQGALGGGKPSEVIMNTLFPLVLLAIPASIGVAILRYRLYDIDIIIKRTLVYSSLTVILAALYFGLVVGAQTLAGLLTGKQAQQQPIVIVLSTLLIAALFQPLRKWLQQGIDRRFYRSRYDAAKTVAAFSASLRSEVDLSQLNERLLLVVEETMRPAQLSLWLREPSQRHLTPPVERPLR